MDSQRTLTKQTSHLRNIPSMNDFNTLTREDMESEMAARPVAIPRLATDRSWSVDSNSGTPHSARSSFADTFTRALYEHMRGN
jgi:autonomous glycyl radical cofactor GrcA